MPGYKLQPTTALKAPRFAVVGMYAHPSRDNSVQHLALLQEDCDLLFGKATAVWHTQPPTIAGVHSSAGTSPDQQQCAVHVVSYLEDLTADEAASIETTRAEIDTQTQPVPPSMAFSHYIIHPPVFWVIDEKTNVRRFRKFSCVGFVLECYQDVAEIRLLDLDPEKLPPVDLETLASIYGDLIRNAKLRERFGLTGPQQEWPIALPGYVMHSLTRPSSDVRKVPYKARGVEEADFPFSATVSS